MEYTLPSDRPMSRSGLLTERRFDGENEDLRTRNSWRIDGELAKERESNAVLTEKVTVLEGNLTTANDAIEGKCREIAEITNEKDNLKGKKSVLKAKYKQLKKDYAELQGKLTIFEQEKCQFDGEKSVFQATIQSLTSEK